MWCLNEAKKGLTDRNLIHATSEKKPFFLFVKMLLLCAFVHANNSYACHAEDLGKSSHNTCFAHAQCTHSLDKKNQKKFFHTDNNMSIHVV
jgi:hypothetical protein